jgi:cytochrome c-type biogenesis protein CcmH/NrfG
MIAGDPQRPEGHFTLGMAYAKQERYPEALEAFPAAYTLDPDDGLTWIHIGQAYVQLGQPEQAIYQYDSC